MKKFFCVILVFIIALTLVSCRAERNDARAVRHKGSVAESRVRDRRKLLENSSSGENNDTEKESDTNENNAETIVLKLAEVHETGYPTTLADEKFAELVEQKTNGKVKIEVYPDGKLGSESEAVAQMQEGTVDFARVSLSPMAQYEPKLNVLLMPYLYDDDKHMWKVLNSPIGQDMLDSIDSAGLVGLAWYDSGARNFFLNREIHSVYDFAGARVRMQNNSLMFGLAEALGCQPVDMGMGDINTAIEQGILDGAENNIPTYESFGHVKFAPNYILDSHSRIPEILAGSGKTFDKLTEDQKKTIKECAKETQEYEIEQWNEREKKSKEIIESQGVNFIELDEQTISDIRDRCEPLYDEFAGDYKDIIEQIRDMAD
ncbi:MAG: TRAP transporter substrate-binding protein [Firmicutes bacterium]|nr:TRAP transporter substrate-binding protein [Bacillota bacterium]